MMKQEKVLYPYAPNITMADIEEAGVLENRTWMLQFCVANNLMCIDDTLGTTLEELAFRIKQYFGVEAETVIFMDIRAYRNLFSYTYTPIGNQMKMTVNPKMQELEMLLRHAQGRVKFLEGQVKTLNETLKRIKNAGDW